LTAEEDNRGARAETGAERPAKGEPPIDRSGSEGTTVAIVLADYAEAGFDSSFSVLPGSRLQCLSCRQESAAGTVTMASLRRMEGESDPADMVAIVAVTCPACGAQGTLVLGFGPNAAPEDADVLRDLDDQRASDELPGSTAPGEGAVASQPDR
jgi:hypothetical protein